MAVCRRDQQKFCYNRRRPGHVKQTRELHKQKEVSRRIREGIYKDKKRGERKRRLGLRHRSGLASPIPVRPAVSRRVRGFTSPPPLFYAYAGMHLQPARRSGSSASALPWTFAGLPRVQAAQLSRPLPALWSVEPPSAGAVAMTAPRDARTRPASFCRKPPPPASLYYRGFAAATASLRLCCLL